jgi:hypothetical protein
MCTLTDISALAAAGGGVGQPSRLIMRMSPIDVKFSSVEMSLLMQLAGSLMSVQFFTFFFCAYSFLSLCPRSQAPCS